MQISAKAQQNKKKIRVCFDQLLVRVLSDVTHFKNTFALKNNTNLGIYIQITVAIDNKL